jgi:hypothetical protein
MIAFLYTLIDLVSSAIPVVIGIAVLVFLWGLFKYTVSDDETKKRDAKQVIIYGIVTLFVMVALWGLVFILAETFNINVRGGWAPGYIYY